MAEDQLTVRQKQILKMRFVDGMKQQDIADELGITQGAISLQINGIPNYVYKRKHGGIIKKLKRLCSVEDNILSKGRDEAVRHAAIKLRKTEKLDEKESLERAEEVIQKMERIRFLFIQLMATNKI